MTQIKTFFVDHPEELENLINAWLKNNNADIDQILPLPLLKNEHPALMVIVVYSKEEWK